MQTVVTQHSMDIVDAAHLLAMGNIVTTDAGIACYDSKFFYLAWRPITAIRNADKDGNPGHDRRPELAGAARRARAPGVSVAARLLHLCVRRHACVGAQHEGHRRHRSRGGQNGSSNLTTTQHFNTVDDIQKQVVDARVWLGFHFRNSVVQGEDVGNDVARWELHQFFKPTHP